MIFSGKDLYSSLIAKAAALGVAIIMNHPFVDGNKRIDHAAVKSFLFLNGQAIRVSVDEQESMVLALATGELGRETFVEWLQQHTVPINTPNPTDG